MTDATAAAPIAAPAALPDAGESDAPGKSARQSVLDELLDADGPLTVQQIIDATGVDRNSVDQALHRLVEAGDALRVGRGLYVKAPPKPKAPPRPPLPPITLGDGRPVEEWMAILEAWHADPSTWDVATLGPRPDDLKNQVPGMVAMMFRRRLDAREKAAEEAAAAPPKAVAPADDVELLKQLLDATHGNVVDGPDIRDIGPIVAVLKTIPIEHVLYTIRGKHDPRVYPKNPRLRSWRDQALLRAIAERFCRTVLVPAMVEKRSNTAPGQPVQTPAAPAAVFCTAARALLAEGVDPATRLIMRHEGSAHDAPRSTVGEAAGLTVVDDTGGKPIFRKWKPCDRGEETIPVASPMRKTDPAAVESAIGPGKGVNETLERSDAARRGGNPGDVAVRQC